MMDWAKVYQLAVEFLADRRLDDLNAEPLVPPVRCVTQDQLDFICPCSGARGDADLLHGAILLGPKADATTPLHEWFHLAVRDAEGHYQCGAVAQEFAEWAAPRLQR